MRSPIEVPKGRAVRFTYHDELLGNRPLSDWDHVSLRLPSGEELDIGGFEVIEGIALPPGEYVIEGRRVSGNRNVSQKFNVEEGTGVVEVIVDGKR
jgi:hypothetical protein